MKKIGIFYAAKPIKPLGWLKRFKKNLVLLPSL